MNKTAAKLMKKPNLLIAITPMQIINGIEAINHFEIENTILVLIFKPRVNNRNNDQLEKAAELYNWEKIIRVNKKLSKRKLYEYLKLISELKQNEFNYVFFGNYTSIYRVILANIKKEHLYLIDDGTKTISFYNNILRKNKVNNFSFKNLRFLFLGLKTRVKDKLSLFTYFNVEKDARFNIVKNNLTYFKSKLSENSNYESSTIFLGQPLVENKIISENDFKYYLNTIISMQKTKIKYIPHRFEKIENLKQFKSELFEILEIDVPVELYFIYNNIYPQKIISFCTTAIFTLEKMYPHLKLEHIEIPQETLLKKQIDFYETYNAIKNETHSKALDL